MNDGGDYIQAPGVCLFAVLGKHGLADHFGDIVCVALVAGCSGFNLKNLLLGCFSFIGCNKAVFKHPLNNVLLPDTGPFGVADGVVGRRRLWQACKHGRLCDGDVFQRLAKIGFTGCCETVSAVA